MSDPAMPEAITGRRGSAPRRGLVRRIGERVRRIGIQWRMMLYVTIGLILMFGLLIFIGLRSADEATTLIFEERLSTARTFSIILERDLFHISADVRGTSSDLLTAGDPSALAAKTEDLLHHIAGTDSFAFFHATRICVIGAERQVLAQASDFPQGVGRGGCPGEVGDRSLRNDYDLLSPTAVAAEDGGFGAVTTRIGSGPKEPNWVIVDLMAYNSSQPVGATLYEAKGSLSDGLAPDRADLNHLEVFRRDGTVVLGIGDDEHPGELSPHFGAVEALDPLETAIVMRHLMPHGEDDHVMAVVPIHDSGFTLVLEQPIDVAMALPMRLRRQLFLWSGIGFGIALVIAWVTTRGVVEPTEQLTAAARRMAQGDLDSPISVAAPDEVGTLAESLESMRLQIRAAYTAVAETNAALEERVEERTARLGVLVNKLITAQEDERHRIARELHDETAQTIGALTIALDRARDSLDDGLAEPLLHLSRARDIAGHLLAETRRLILDLRPMVLDDMGLTPAIRLYIEGRLEDQGIETALRVDQPSTRLPRHIETALFRIVQEAVNNVAKHSRADHARIDLSFRDDKARFVVADDGQGFDVQEQMHRQNVDGGVGLAGIRERVNLLSGLMDVRSDAANGTVIVVEVPIRDGME